MYFLLFFDVTNRGTFNDIDYYIEQIRNNNSSKEIILLGNKIDQSEKRIVKKQEAKEKAEQLNIKYFEICCLNGINILEVLNEIAIMAFNRYKQVYNDNNNNDNNRNNEILYKLEFKKLETKRKELKNKENLNKTNQKIKDLKKQLEDANNKLIKINNKRIGSKLKIKREEITKLDDILKNKNKLHKIENGNIEL